MLNLYDNQKVRLIIDAGAEIIAKTGQVIRITPDAVELEYKIKKERHYILAPRNPDTGDVIGVKPMGGGLGMWVKGGAAVAGPEGYLDNSVIDEYFAGRAMIKVSKGYKGNGISFIVIAGAIALLIGAFLLFQNGGLIPSGSSGQNTPTTTTTNPAYTFTR